MNMQFKGFLAEKILAGEKTQTRRSIERKRAIRDCEVGKRVGVQVGSRPILAHIIIKGTYKQVIGEISEEDAKKDGFPNLEKFKQFWIKNCGCWDPAEEVWVYDFVLDKKDSTSEEKSHDK